MKRTYLVLTAALAMAALAPRSRAQETSKLTVAASVRAPAQIDSIVVAVVKPESVAVDTVKKFTSVKGKTSFLTTAPNV